MKTKTTHHTASALLGAARSFYSIVVRCYRTTFNPSGAGSKRVSNGWHTVPVTPLKRTRFQPLAVTQLSVCCRLSVPMPQSFRLPCPPATSVFSTKTFPHKIAKPRNGASFLRLLCAAIRLRLSELPNSLPGWHFTKSVVQQPVAAGSRSYISKRPMNVLKCLSIHRIAGQGRDKQQMI